MKSIKVQFQVIIGCKTITGTLQITQVKQTLVKRFKEKKVITSDYWEEQNSMV